MEKKSRRDKGGVEETFCYDEVGNPENKTFPSGGWI